MGLKLVYRGRETYVADGTEALIGSDPSATLPIARPGISRRHAVVRHDGVRWVLDDAASRNGTFHNGARIETLDISGPTVVHLGHPSDGETLDLVPSEEADTPKPAATKAAPTRVVPPVTATQAPTNDPRLDELVKTLRDTTASIRGLTWSVWAMIAVTAVLALLTLFVGVIGQ